MIPSDFTRRVQKNPQIAVDLYEALVQITDVYAETRKYLAEQYADDGWSAETMTIDQARAAITKATLPAAHAHYATKLIMDAAARTGETPLDEHVRCVPGMVGGERE